MSKFNKLRRVFLQSAGFFGITSVISQAHAHHTESHFEDDSPHHLVYQCNSADPEYLGHILFSCGEMLRKYGNDIELVITAFGPGLHLLGKRPERPIPKRLQDSVRSLSAYGVAFHACGNTMKTLNWSKEDLLEEATIVQIGAVDLMELQEKGFSYISW